MSEEPPDSPPEFDDSLVVDHVYRDGFETLPATGVSGGIQPSGTFKLDFTLDENPRPEQTYYELDENGVETGRSRDEFEGNYRRIHQTAVTMNQDDAYRHACWIIAERLGGELTWRNIHELIAREFGDQDEPDDNTRGLV